MRVALKKHWKFMETVDQKDMIEFLKDVVYLDRKIRLETEGKQEELKQQLAEAKQVELGYPFNTGGGFGDKIKGV